LEFLVTVPSSDAGGLPLDLDQIESRAEAATPGPWKTWAMRVLADPVGDSNLDRAWLIAHTTDPHRGLRTFNADFIAAARADVPALVARVRALEAEVQQLQEQNGRLEAWRATPRAFDWKGTF
jgi:hypothetical protein